jgi:hypothetical protein
MIKSSFLSALLILWAGLILGVSFIATPVKFRAPHLTMPVALEIGKATFHVFNKVEWCVCLLLVFLTGVSSGSSLKWFFTCSLLGLLLLETFYFLPLLDIRADQIIAGESVKPTLMHWFYIGVDVLKIVLAFIGAWWIICQTQK